MVSDSLHCLKCNMNSGFRFPIHKLVKYQQQMSNQSNGGNYLKTKNMEKERDDMEAKMAQVFGDKIKALSTELQQILLDNMVTAFENRLNVLNRAMLGS